MHDREKFLSQRLLSVLVRRDVLKRKVDFGLEYRVSRCCVVTVVIGDTWLVKMRLYLPSALGNQPALTSGFINRIHFKSSKILDRVNNFQRLKFSADDTDCIQRKFSIPFPASYLFSH
jgi:hypothetical protein